MSHHKLSFPDASIMVDMDDLEPIVEPGAYEPATPRGIEEVLGVVRTVSLAVIAVALVVIAVQLSRSVRADEQRRCLERVDVVARTHSGDSAEGVLQEHRGAMLGCVGLNPAEVRADQTVLREGVVPDVTGKPLREAAEILRAWGFQSAPHERDPQDPEALVWAQEPGGGLVVPGGATVGLRTRVEGR